MTQQQFFDCLFDPTDLVLVRVVQSWKDDQGRIKSKILITKYFEAQHVSQGLKSSEIVNAAKLGCTYFGTCPRQGGDERFDASCQIAKVNFLWADLDNCKPVEALERFKNAGLERPSILTSSGHGTHGYLRLDKPCLIEGALRHPIDFEYVQVNDKWKRKRSIPDLGLHDHEREFKRLMRPCDQARRLQSFLRGIADKINGDIRTVDLSRLLRVPGSMNNKCKLNGQTPKRCEIVPC